MEWLVHIDSFCEAGVVILPPSQGKVEATPQENGDDNVDNDHTMLKWPPKPGFSKVICLILKILCLIVHQRGLA